MAAQVSNTLHLSLFLFQLWLSQKRFCTFKDSCDIYVLKHQLIKVFEIKFYITWWFIHVQLKKDIAQLCCRFSLFFLFGPVKAKEFLGIELPGGIHIWPSVRDTRLLDRSDISYFIYLLRFASFLFIPFPLFHHLLIYRKTEEKSRSVSGKIGQVPMETKFWDTPILSPVTSLLYF